MLAAFRNAGFTLIELMVTVAIIAILAAIAYPSYATYLVRTHRHAAQAVVMEVSGAQQRYFLDARGYTSDLTKLPVAIPADVSRNYTITTAAKTTTLPGFTVTATPQGAQATRDARCGTLTMDETGATTASGSDGADKCW